MSNIPIFTNALKMTLYSEIVWHISDILQYVLQVTTESQQQIDEEAARWKEKTFERFLRAEKKNEISWELFLDAPSMRIFPPFNRWLFHYQNKKNRSMYGNNSPLWVMNKNIRISMRYFFTGWKRAETFEHPPPPPSSSMEQFPKESLEVESSKSHSNSFVTSLSARPIPKLFLFLCLPFREVIKKRSFYGQADRKGGGGVSPLDPDRKQMWKFWSNWYKMVK